MSVLIDTAILCTARTLFSETPLTPNHPPFLAVRFVDRLGNRVTLAADEIAGYLTTETENDLVLLTRAGERIQVNPSESQLARLFPIMEYLFDGERL